MEDAHHSQFTEPLICPHCALPSIAFPMQVYVCQQEFFLRPGPRLVDGIEMLGRILHPEAVKGKIPRDRALKLTLSGGRRCRQSLLHNYFEPFS